MATNWARLNGDHDDDAALRRAIAMSLDEAPPSVERDESAAPSRLTGLPSHNSSPGKAPAQAHQSHSMSSSMSAFGLDRKKMEEERLARSRKRKADDCAQGPTAQRPRLQQAAMTQPPMHATGAGSNSEPRTAQGSTGVPKASLSRHLAYPKGAVLRTWARGTPREDNDITIEEVLQKDELELAVLSSFQWDDDWLLSKIDMRRTKVLMIAYAKDDAQVCLLATATRQWSTFHVTAFRYSVLAEQSQILSCKAWV